MWDADGNRLLDFVQSYGASLLGHAHPAVVAAVDRRGRRGTTFGAPTEGEVLLAEAICDRVPGCDQVRLVSSGTEAAMSAVRVARGFTGRARVVKFAGCYHGHSDGLLAGGGSGVATLGLPDSAGVPAGAVAETVVAPYNVVPELDDAVACVIVEPVAANMGLVPPAPGFLEGLRAACDAVGALLVFDEVITGFRLGSGGASEWSGVRPDLWCFGKVIGGGLPVGAFGGRGDVLEVLAPDGPVYQAGTLSGNPLATAAGLQVLAIADAEAYVALADRVAGFGAALAGGLADGRAGRVPASASGSPWSGPGRRVLRGRRPGGHRLRRGGGGRGQRDVRPVLPRHARPGGGPRPGSLRGGVPVDGPRRRRTGPGRVGGGGGRGRRGTPGVSPGPAGPGDVPTAAPVGAGRADR